MIAPFRQAERARAIMQEVNAIRRSITDMQGRLDALRGYL